MRGMLQLCAVTFVAASVVMWSGGCDPDDPVSLYATEPLAPSLGEADVEGLEHLGPSLIDQGVNFGVW